MITTVDKASIASSVPGKPQTKAIDQAKPIPNPKKPKVIIFPEKKHKINGERASEILTPISQNNRKSERYSRQSTRIREPRQISIISMSEKEERERGERC